MKFKLIFFPIFSIALVFIFVYLFQYFSRAYGVKANIVVDINHKVGDMPTNWKAYAQGGEETGTRMLGNVIKQMSALNPSYIRLDHMYDFYNVVSKDSRGTISFNWRTLDQTVCDILDTGARPFFSLGYMPPAISADGSLISKPSSWNDWSYVVQKTIEHYSSSTVLLCGKYSNNTNIYYEVWNEPDLETFGKWSLYDGNKNYKSLYYYSVLGANKAQNVKSFLIGGPATTAAYKNWTQLFLDYVRDNNLRIDFLSWHHYSKNPDDFSTDLRNVDSWLSDPKYAQYQLLPRIISEWGFDSEPNSVSDSYLGAAYMVTSIRNFINEKIALAFHFEVKDGPVPRWGILTQDGTPKLRYNVLKFLNEIQGQQIQVDGESDHVRAIATTQPGKTFILLVNYDVNSRNTELVPVHIKGLENGTYNYSIINFSNELLSKKSVEVVNNEYSVSALMTPNAVVGIVLEK